jgi:hypothetical protein
MRDENLEDVSRENETSIGYYAPISKKRGYIALHLSSVGP